MTQAPSIKEALERLIGSSEAFLRYFNPFNLASDKENQWHSVNEDIARAKSVLATLQPSGERREAIARIIEDNIEVDIDFELADFKVNGKPAADKIIASGLVQDEAAIRADEREKCAKEIDARAEEIALKQREQNPLGTSYLREAKNYREASAAIRFARDGGAS